MEAMVILIAPMPTSTLVGHNIARSVRKGVFPKRLRFEGVFQRDL